MRRIDNDIEGNFGRSILYRRNAAVSDEGNQKSRLSQYHGIPGYGSIDITWLIFYENLINIFKKRLANLKIAVIMSLKGG